VLVDIIKSTGSVADAMLAGQLNQQAKMAIAEHVKDFIIEVTIHITIFYSYRTINVGSC